MFDGGFVLGSPPAFSLGGMEHLENHVYEGMCAEDTQGKLAERAWGWCESFGTGHVGF